MSRFERAVLIRNRATVKALEMAIHDEFSEVSHIPQGSDTVLVQLARVKISIAFDHTYTSTKVYIPQQHAPAIVEEYEVDASMLIMSAEQFAKSIPIVHVQPMIAIFASPESNVDRPFAFGSQ
ncbi:hypothetical protein BGZ74_005026 [Mortierella antarctica]|nr:hypothetical protein BGZ74_005026 [Mortierella antarctica]